MNKKADQLTNLCQLIENERLLRYLARIIIGNQFVFLNAHCDMEIHSIKCRCDEIPHRTAPDPPQKKKLGERSPQSGKTTGSPGTLTLMGGHP